MDIRQGTATTLWVGPVVSTSGITSSTAYTLVWKIAKNNGAFAATTGVNTGSTTLKGFYKCPLTATNVGTLGELVVGTQSTAYYLYVWDRHRVVTANYYDTRYGTDEFQVDVVQVIGSTSGADDLEGLVDDIAGLNDVSTTDIFTQIILSTEIDDIASVLGALNNVSTTDILTQAHIAVDASTQIDDIATVLGALNDAVDVSTDVNDILTNIGALNDVSTTDILTQSKAGVDASTQIDDIATVLAGLNDAVDVSTDVNDILTNIGALNDVGTTDILTQTNVALIAQDLDHLSKVDKAGVSPTSGSLFDLIMSKSTDQTFSQANDSLEAIRDRGDAGWITGGGTGVNYSSTDVYDQALAAVNASTMVYQIIDDTSEIQGKLPTSNIAGSTELADVDTAIGALNDAVDVSTDVNDILTNIAALNDAVDVSTDVNDIYTAIGALNDISTTDILTQTDIALIARNLDHIAHVDAIGADPTSGSYLDLIMNKSTNQTFSQANDSLEAIRDRGDATWVTATDVSTDVNDILTNIAALNDAVDVSTDVNDILTNIGALNDVSTTDILTQAQDAVDASTQIDDIATVLGALNDAVDVSTDVNDILTNIAALNDVSTTDIVTQANAALASAVTEPTALSMTKSIDNMMWGVYGRFYHKNLQGTSDQITYTSTGGEFATRDITSSTSDQMIDKAT